MSIFDLRETAPNNWKAKYRGNYGTYTIKIVINGAKVNAFSCSCPSDYYPCKHIPMVQEEIKKRISVARQLSPKEEDVSVESVLKNVSIDELRNFIIRLAQYNQDLSNAVLLEFSQKISSSGGNNYSGIIRKALKKLDFNDEDFYEYDESYIEIEILDQWIEKARQLANKENFSEAIWVCKACIEEYADWLSEARGDIQDYIIDDTYQYSPFEILEEIVSKSDLFSTELYEYCKTEISKIKYKTTGICDAFNDLMGKLAPTAAPKSFIEFQDQLLSEISDKKSNEARQVIQRKIDFYNTTAQPDKAWELIASNIQIEFYRKEWVEKKIAENKLNEAKKLIMDFLSTNNGYHQFQWDELLLTIAQRENDIPAIRRISFSFIEKQFKTTYYQAYKSTYTTQKWLPEIEHLIRHYQENSRGFSSNIAELLLAENQTERLMDYVEKYLSIHALDMYHIHFPSSEKTLILFRRAIDEYAQKNIGRTHYEYIARLFTKMNKIQGGNVVVDEMILNYKLLYKNRRAMIEILNRLQCNRKTSK